MNTLLEEIKDYAGISEDVNPDFYKAKRELEAGLKYGPDISKKEKRENRRLYKNFIKAGSPLGEIGRRAIANTPLEKRIKIDAYTTDKNEKIYLCHVIDYNSAEDEKAWNTKLMKDIDRLMGKGNVIDGDYEGETYFFWVKATAPFFDGKDLRSVLRYTGTFDPKVSEIEKQHETASIRYARTGINGNKNR